MASDIDNTTNIRAKSSIHCCTNTWADCRISTWQDSTLFSAIDHLFVIAPSNLEFLTGEHMRSPKDPASVRVNFERPFATPPKLVVFFNLIDLDHSRNWRLKTTATDMDQNGFTLNIDTWGDTILHAAQACWIAYPEDREHIFSTSVYTTDVRPSYLPQLQQSQAIKFNYVDGVSKTGLTWHIDSWLDTVLYSAGASIIAFN